MFKIGEFSKLTQVSIRMLRYYDEMGLLKPQKVDPFSGYRLYATEQIPTLNQIIFLRDLGFGVAEIAAALSDWSAESIREKLCGKREEIRAAMRAQEEKLAKIELAQKDLRQEKIEIHYNVTIKAVPAQAVFSLRRTVADYYAEGGLWKEMAAFAAAANIPIADETFTIYHDPDYREQDVDIEICAPVAKMGQDEGGFTYRVIAAVPLMASSMVYGPFENIAGAYRAFAGWLQKHNRYRMGAGSRQIVHRGPWNEEDAARYLTEIQIPLKEK